MGRHTTQYSRLTRYALLLALAALAPILSISLAPRVQADVPYSLNPVPASTQEGNTVSLVLTVSNANPSTTYEFVFFVRDPASRTFQSQPENFTTLPGQNQFSIVAVYPSTTFPGSNSLVGQYTTRVDQLRPVAVPTVAQNSFFLSITDTTAYERTQTVNVQASAYNASESVTVTIRTQTISALVFSQTISATLAGIVAASWKIPRNATVDNYRATLTGTSTAKSPADTQLFSVRAAVMSITSIASLKPVYQRTETMKFSFQPTYPDGSTPSTGVGLLTLARPSGGSVTLTATYDSAAQTFNATYKTSMNNQTGTWTATLGGHAYSDAYGNTGPGTQLTSTPQLTPAALAITVAANTNTAVGQQLKFNATVTYPDGTTLRSGTVKAYLLYSGASTVNDTVPVVFDTGLGLWIGTYTVQPSDTGGLWSLIVKASDSPTPPNTGSATRAINIQNTTSGGNVSFPLYYFGILAALIAALLIAIFLVFKRRRVTHAKLKIDLEAVRSEAGRIENQEFFQSVRDQLKKNKDD